MSGHLVVFPDIFRRSLVRLTLILDMVVDKYEQYFKDHNRVKEFSGHSLKVHTVAWSADGKRLASGSLDKEQAFHWIKRKAIRDRRERSRKALPMGKCCLKSTGTRFLRLIPLLLRYHTVDLNETLRVYGFHLQLLHRQLFELTYCPLLKRLRKSLKVNFP